MKRLALPEQRASPVRFRNIRKRPSSSVGSAEPTLALCQSHDLLQTFSNVMTLRKGLLATADAEPQVQTTSSAPLATLCGIDLRA